MKSTKLIDVFGDVLTDGGLFVKLNALNVPWISDDISADVLDNAYFYNFSGQKTISPLLRRYLNGAEKITDSQMVSLANIIYKIYIKNWNKLYATLSLEYNPISNYDMTESETVENEKTNSREGSQSVSTTTSGNSADNVFGFNSSGAVGDSTTTTSATNSTTSTDSDSGSGTDNTERTLTRSGNIGVTTSQQMIESERDLWRWKFFFDVVFPDIDEVLTVATYHR